MIAETQLQTLNNLARNWVVKIVILVLTLASCRSNKYNNDLPSIDQYNGYSYTQRGFNIAETGDSAIVAGQIKYFGSNKPVAEARIAFINMKEDTVMSAKTDKSGKFMARFTHLGFSGRAVVYHPHVIFEIPHITIYPVYKNYLLDIKISRPLELISADKFSKEEMQELRELFKQRERPKKREEK